MSFRSLLAVVGLLGPFTANATVYTGNPSLTFHVTRPENDFVGGYVVLHQLRIRKCNNQTLTYTIDDEIDPVDGWSKTISGGDYCAATLVWDTVMEIDGSSFVIEHDAASTVVPLSGSSQTVVLSPIDVVSGTFSGNLPRLVLTIQ
jgi:hypothetical protein